MSGVEARFCLDADSLITPKNGPYRFDIWPEFWSFLEEQVRSGRVYSCWGVYEEWVKGEDRLAEWAKDLKDAGLCTDPTDEVQGLYKEIVAYVSATYEEANAARFLKCGDPWVIAQAATDDATVVSFETLVNDQSKKCKIPNICQIPGVACINLWEMLGLIKSG